MEQVSGLMALGAQRKADLSCPAAKKSNVEVHKWLAVTLMLETSGFNML